MLTWDTSAFLARVVAPGNYLATAFSSPVDNIFAQRFFPYAAIVDAAAFLQAKAAAGAQAYHAMASFNVAAANGTDTFGVVYHGKRSQDQVHALKCFWVDLDVARPGDGKDPSRTFATQAHAAAWMLRFCATIKLPVPNLAVNSGYGVHAYWVLDTPLSLADWAPWAQALKAALLANGFTGDSGLVANAACILRPPGTLNHKVPGAPMPVSRLPVRQMDHPDYALAALTPALTPFRSVTTVTTPTGPQSSALAGGGAVVQGLFAQRTKPLPNAAAAAQANLPATLPRLFSAIATQCQQVAKSLAEHGAHDTRDLWYLGHLTLATYCADGAAFIHPIGDGHAKYSPAGTDAEFARAVREQQAKAALGPPTCASYDTRRANVCPTCPHYGRVKTPWALGDSQSVSDLPLGYRRGATGIEVEIKIAAKGKKTASTYWAQMVLGDVANPVLYQLGVGQGYTFTFDYLRQGITYPATFDTVELSAHRPVFEASVRSKIIIQDDSTTQWRRFLLAWVELLRSHRLQRTQLSQPFGWIRDASGNHAGMAVAGTIYLPDGREERSSGALDSELRAAYTPRGSLARWQATCDLITAQRVDLQLLVAASFAAPLMHHTGHAGMVVSMWSSQSGLGKTSAINVGQAVWGEPTLINSTNDTANSAMKKISDTYMMPSYWDEMGVGTNDEDKLLTTVMAFSQGKSKGRLNANAMMQSVSEWETIMVTANNFPLMDRIMAKSTYTNAGAVRLFEFKVERPPTPSMPAAAMAVQALRQNFGRAGEVYAKFLSTNFDLVRATVGKIIVELNAQLQSDNSERFYIAGMAAIIVGASIANKLKLTKFDLPQLRKLLCDEFINMRAARSGATVSAVGYNLEQIVSTFMSATLANRIVTSRFRPPGPNSTTYAVMQAPWDQTKSASVQIAVQERTLRIDDAVFAAWCYKNKYAAGDIVDKLVTQWAAKVKFHMVIAAGTSFVNKTKVLDIPMLNPTLEAYLPADSSAGQTSALAPGAALKPVTP